MTTDRILWSLALLLMSGAWVAGSLGGATGSTAVAQSAPAKIGQPPASVQPSGSVDNIAKLAERLNDQGAAPGTPVPSTDPSVDRARGLATAASREADRLLPSQSGRSLRASAGGIQVAQASTGDDVIENGRTTFREIWRRLHSDSAPPVIAPAPPAAKPLTPPPAPTASVPPATAPATAAKPSTTAQVPVAQSASSHETFSAAGPPFAGGNARRCQQAGSHQLAHRHRSSRGTRDRGTGSRNGSGR